MKLLLDGQEMKSAEFGGQTLSELIDGVEKELAPERVIVSMLLNGEPLENSEERQNTALPVQELDSLVINTQQVGALALNTLHTLTQYFPELKSSVAACVETLQSEDESEGHMSLSTLVEGLQMVSSAWHGIARFLEIEGRKPVDVIPEMNGFNGLLADTLRAQQNGDIVQLCDLLEFELVPIIEQWETHAGNLIGEMEKQEQA
ncbi:MAG: hypothetical protein FVQ81_00775 [Candidatus Glassbacteria bacterium]|nr:hypothetical protein [Candidatus Glassbacteria bacterium]